MTGWMLYLLIMSLAQTHSAWLLEDDELTLNNDDTGHQTAQSAPVSQALDFACVWWRHEEWEEGREKEKGKKLRNEKVTFIALPAAMGLFLPLPQGAEGSRCHFKHCFILTKAWLHATALKSQCLPGQWSTSNCSGYPEVPQPPSLF